MDLGRFRLPAGVTTWLVAVAVAALLLGTGLSGPGPDGAARVVGAVLLAGGGLALAARGRAPLAVLVVTALCALGYQTAGFEVLSVPYLVAVYGAVRAGHHLFTVITTVALFLALHVGALLFHDGTAREALGQARGTLEVAWLIAAFAAGEALRQAERRAAEAERSREETARRRADEERLHIARELHDSLTHQISIIKVQSEVAVHVAKRRGEEVSEALLAIQEAGREATRELRATLEALRDDATAPPRGLDDLKELVERAGRGGLDVTLTVEGRRGDVPAAVSRSAYRIVQEALTNVVRHADATTAAVGVEHRPGTLTLRIDDNGRATGSHEPGLGLLGMRERVTALGGRIETGPRAEGGFSVRAELPVEAAR
ncbi:sensor histidine kinase [Streptomyces sp. NPDC050418]|uniref:sensor histidine kinase n=1 Tax=Streptomyces sp. NPDC050418 TaxID=3365612 RepID=UPI0037A1FAF9